MAGLYELPDEPRPGTLQRVAVRPLWPLLALMVAGPWLSWPWFVLNGHAVGSPTRWRETALALVGVLGSAVLFGAIWLAARADLYGGALGVHLSLLVLLLWKLGISYWLVVLQSPAVQLFEYYRGTLRNPMILLVAGFFADRYVWKALPPFLRLVIG